MTCILGSLGQETRAGVEPGLAANTQIQGPDSSIRTPGHSMADESHLQSPQKHDEGNLLSTPDSRREAKEHACPLSTASRQLPMALSGSRKSPCACGPSTLKEKTLARSQATVSQAPGIVKGNPQRLPPILFQGPKVYN